MNDPDFPFQFIISSTHDTGRPGWKSINVGTKKVLHHSELDVIKVLDSADKLVGLVMGWAIDANGSLLEGAVKLNFLAEDSDFESKLEHYYEHLSGRFVALVLMESFHRLYLDPAGQMSAVYDTETGKIASSTFLLKPYKKPDDELSKVLGLPDKDNFFPFGLTIDQSVLRIIPNHYLDLQSLEQVRHWPKSVEFNEGSPKDISRTIGDLVRKNMTAIGNRYPLSLALTAGKDSRMLLAAAKGLVNKLETYTTHIPDGQANLDCKVALAIAKEHGIQHKVVRWCEPNASDLLSWQIRGGYSGAGRTWQSVTTLSTLDPTKAYIEGLCGEVGRAFYWAKDDLNGAALDPQLILERMKFTLHPKLLEGARRWLDGIPDMHTCDALDLLYIEQRLGCWAGPNYYGHVSGVRLAPLSDRNIFNLMLQLPKEYRYSDQLPTDVIEYLWPELLKFPFNEPIGMARVRWIVRKNMRRELFRFRRFWSG